MASQDELIPGTLEVLTLGILSHGALHGWGIAQKLKLLSREILQVNQGSLYPALHKLEAAGWVKAEWKATPEGRQAKFYALTATGRKRLAGEKARWARLSTAMSWVLDA
ncbi:MAG: PadR family transcriptional regulator [Bryobacteraceae bacterium]|nr:PadR family transcriptional regulator [Bryobacteraceae bacterium]